MYLLETTGTIITANVVEHVPEASENDSYLLSASLYSVLLWNILF